VSKASGKAHLKVVAIIQARMGSTRLPGKVLLDLAGASILLRVLERVRRTDSIDEVVVATTDKPSDDIIVQECLRYQIPVFRGQEEDVLDRYYRAAVSAKADIVVRITSDCPLIDPEITRKTVQAFLAERPDYASNCLVRTYPRGLDTEVMTLHALERTWREAKQPYQREHVTPYIHENPDEFKLLSVTGEADYSGHRWTVDTPEDFELVRSVYTRLQHRNQFSWRDVIDLLQREPELAELNRSVAQKALHAG
jgi:spore coat polysaccharide biosynthesis protein SpsF